MTPSVRRPSPSPSSSAATATMRANRRRDTRPEMALRRLLHARGHRFRVDLPIRLGDRICRPDVVFRSRKVAVFVDGCFWHSCPLHGSLPRSNAGYWVPKLRSNEERDRRTTAELAELGWTVIRIWEHEDPANAVNRIEGALRRPGPGAPSSRLR